MKNDKTLKQKIELKDGYYYSGYHMQRYDFQIINQPVLVCMWDEKNDCFWFWEFEGFRKAKTKLSYLLDIENEVESGFFPTKEIIPNDEQIIE